MSLVMGLRAGGRGAPCAAHAGAAPGLLWNRCGGGHQPRVQRMRVRPRGSAGGKPCADGSAWLYQTPWPEPRSINLHEFMERYSKNLIKFGEWIIVILCLPVHMNL